MCVCVDKQNALRDADGLNWLKKWVSDVGRQGLEFLPVNYGYFLREALDICCDDAHLAVGFERLGREPTLADAMNPRSRQ